MKETDSFKEIVFEGFEGLVEEKSFLIEKMQVLLDKLPSDSKFFIQFQKIGSEYFCSFKSISLQAAFFAVVSGNSIYSLQKKIEVGIKEQVKDWRDFKSKVTQKSFNHFVPKRFSFFSKNKIAG